MGRKRQDPSPVRGGDDKVSKRCTSDERTAGFALAPYGKHAVLLDWNNPLQLDAPRRRVVRQTIDDKIKLINLKSKRAKGPKKHSTNKERSFADRQEHARRTKARKTLADAREAYTVACREYWCGKRAEHPKPAFY